MKKGIKYVAVLLGISLAAGVVMGGCASKKETTTQAEVKKSGFAPALDTKKEVTIEVAGFVGNFEALDQVVNDFNKYYPNVSVNYEQNSTNELSEYLKNNEYVDIFMTNDANVRSADDAKKYVYENCLDLSKEDIDTSAIDPELLSACTVNGSLVRIPLARMMCGMVVNKTLLENEGLDMPQNYEEFLEVCEALKEKGYVPIQGAKCHVYSDMMLPMAMNIIGNDEDLAAKVNAGDASAAQAMQPVAEKLEEICQKGYTSYELNSTYPDDNYDQAILKFFEGNVPFWICNTENVSGMKKRESKSETFSANPFEYEFVNVPLGDDAAYDYEEAWYGFSVNRDSDQIDYAVEFLNFLMTEDELNKLAEVKGMPSVAKNSKDERFNDALNQKKVQSRYVYNGTLRAGITDTIANLCNNYGAGKLESVDAALQKLASDMETKEE